MSYEDDKMNNSVSLSQSSQSNRSLDLCKRMVTTESFIAEAKEIYGDRYDYSKVSYKNREHRVTIVCPIHGEFEIYAREHLDGKGCPKCEKGEKFIEKLTKKFGDKFGLEEFVYESSTSPVTLTCPIHGVFSKLPHAILNSKCGCPECGNDVQEQAHQDAIEHKEERELARKERQRARKEAERLLEESLAIEKWNERIMIIIEQEELSDSYQDKSWHEDFFGFDLNSFCLDNGILLDGKIHCFLRPKHWPFREMKAEACQGLLLSATFYSLYLTNNRLYELLLILESLTSDGYIDPIEEIKGQLQPYLDKDFSFSGIRDGYKFLLTKRRDFITLKIRKIDAKDQNNRNYRTYEVKSLPRSFVGIDFETLYPQRVSACSVGMVKYIDGEIADKYYTLIRPPYDYPGKCGDVLTWIHGLTEDMVKNERTFAEILPEMERFVDGLPLVAHNACVERACIRDASEFYGIETNLDFENIFDTLVLSRQTEAKLGISVEGRGSHKLDAVCKRFGISSNDHHNALADAEMSGNLMVLFQKILCEGEAVEINETPTKPIQKYNPEDKVQRTDLDNVVDNPFKNQVVVLTGFAKSASQEYAHKLNELGAIIKDGMTKKTNILITGYNAGPSKLRMAQEIGARIISEEEFKELINTL